VSVSVKYLNCVGFRPVRKVEVLNINKSAKISIISLILLSFFAAPSLGITATISNNVGSSTVDYHLDKQAALTDHGILGDDFNIRTVQVSGSGDNAYSYWASAQGSNVQGSIANSGQVSASTSTLALQGGVSLNQLVGGAGDTIASAVGSSGQTSTGQESAASNGDLAAAMSVYSGAGSSQSVQNSQISGDVGYVLGGSTAPGNSMFVSGSFAGSGNIDADLTSVAADKAEVRGSALGGGAVGIGDDTLQSIASNEGLGFGVDALYTTPMNGLGEYQLQAANAKTSGQKAAPEPSYKIFGRLQSNPSIHLELLTNTVPAELTAGDLITGTAVGTAISMGANAWDSNTKQQLFLGSDSQNAPGTANALELSSKTITYESTQSATDKAWTMGWTSSLPIINGGTIIAQTSLWTNGLRAQAYNKKSYPLITESDCWFNSKLTWTMANKQSSTTSNIFDVQTIATHELGHYLGLDDLYANSNSNQIMYGYNNGQVKWTLQNGDLAGLNALYGPK
jgi:hypothetical protein